MSRGAAISNDNPVGEVSNFPDPQHNQIPALAYADGVIVQRQSSVVDSLEPQQYLLWNPRDGSYEPLWASEPGRQDFPAGADGEWLATVRFGQSLPFADWSLIVRNPLTGEARTIAESDERVPAEPGLAVGLPLGFAPFPSINDGRVVWVEWAFGDDGLIHKYLRLYDIGANTTRTVVTVDDPRIEDIREPSLGGTRLAWIHDRNDWNESQIVVLDLVTGDERRFVADAIPYRGRISADGRYFAFDVEYRAKYALEIDTLKVDRFASDEGDQIVVTNDGVSWLPGGGANARAGYYDFNARTVRMTAGNGGNAGGLLGNGLFYFREFTVDERGREIEELTTYYIIDISR